MLEKTTWSANNDIHCTDYFFLFLEIFTTNDKPSWHIVIVAEWTNDFICLYAKFSGWHHYKNTKSINRAPSLLIQLLHNRNQIRECLPGPCPRAHHHISTSQRMRQHSSLRLCHFNKLCFKKSANGRFRNRQIRKPNLYLALIARLSNRSINDDLFFIFFFFLFISISLLIFIIQYSLRRCFR